MNTYYLAIDIGASSGRHILGHVENGRIILEEIHRFDNRQVRRNGHDCWDMDNLWKGILDGLKACKTLGKIPDTIELHVFEEDLHGSALGDQASSRVRSQPMSDAAKWVLLASAWLDKRFATELPADTITK